MGILQARMLECVAMPFSTRSLYVPSDQTAGGSHHELCSVTPLRFQIPLTFVHCHRELSCHCYCWLALSPTLSQGLSQPLIWCEMSPEPHRLCWSQLLQCLSSPPNKGSVLLKEAGRKQLVPNQPLSPDSAPLPWLLHSPLTWLALLLHHSPNQWLPGNQWVRRSHHKEPRGPFSQLPCQDALFEQFTRILGGGKSNKWANAYKHSYTQSKPFLSGMKNWKNS